MQIQTPGGARYQANCVCTLADQSPTLTPGAAPSDTTIVYACKDQVPTGPWVNITGIGHNWVKIRTNIQLLIYTFIIIYKMNKLIDTYKQTK